MKTKFELLKQQLEHLGLSQKDVEVMLLKYLYKIPSPEAQ